MRMKMKMGGERERWDEREEMLWWTQGGEENICGCLRNGGSSQALRDQGRKARAGPLRPAVTRDDITTY